MEKTISQIVSRTVEDDPERLCIVDSNGEHTYKEFWDMVGLGIAGFEHYGVKKGDYVLVECTQDAMYLACDLACNCMGAVFVPIEHKVSANRLLEIATETGSKYLICSQNFEVLLMGDIQMQIIRYEALIEFGLVNKNSVDNIKIDYDIDGSDVAEVLFTTGTTGKSKGIEITHLNNIALAENIAYGVEMREGNVELIPVPISHSHGLRCCYANFYRKGSVILTDGVAKILDIYKLIQKYAVTAMDFSPSAMAFLLKVSKGKFGVYDSQLDYIQIGTALLTEDLKRKLKEQFPHVRLYNFYGSTESGRSCVLNFNSEDDREYCIGIPTKNSKFIVADINRNRIDSSPHNTGVLACAGTMNMRGYLNQPELTASVLKDGYLYTNDEAYIDEKGFVYVLGRMDDVINYKGIKISPIEIEEVANRYEGIVDCACVSKDDKNAGQIPKLFVVVNAGNYNRSELIAYLRENIDYNKIPREIEEIEEIPRTYNGKILRRELAKRTL